jgi:two-component system chemotaxis sensor kinase CheA
MGFDMSQFLQTFYEESFEGLEVMETGLLDLDVGSADNELINSIFRAAHSIKGGSATFGLSEVASFTHLMETLLDELRDGQREVSQRLVDILLKSVDCLKDMLTDCQSETPIDQALVAEVKKMLQQELDGSVPTASAKVSVGASSPEKSPTESGWQITFTPHSDMFHTGNDPVRILRELSEMGDYTPSVNLSQLPSFDDIDPETSYLGWDVTLWGAVKQEEIEEVFSWVEDECEVTLDNFAEHDLPVAEVESELAVSSEQNDQMESSAKVRTKKSAAATEASSIRVGIEKVDAMINLVGELVITQSMLSTLGESFDMGQLQRLKDGLAQLEQNTRELQEDVMRMRMLSVSFVFNRFPRMVRDLSQKLGKNIELVMSGENTEIDKTLIEKISDPLVHLVRNSVDHGIELPQERIAAGKPTTGTINLNAFHKGGNIVIEVKDDGKGLDPERLFRKAVEKGVVAADAKLTNEQIYNLIFEPGFSTAEQLSDVSGRGVGMDVVRRNIHSLGGAVEISSQLGSGSTMTVRLPLTLAILDGQSVMVGDQVYIVPLGSIVESIQVNSSMVNKMAGKGETFVLRGAYLSIIRLSDIFNIDSTVKTLEEGLLVVVEAEGRLVGIFVDDLLGQQQVVIKSLEANYQKVDGISGATILGDGSVALILDIPSLVRMSSKKGVEPKLLKTA